MAWIAEGYQTVVVIGASNGKTINYILKYDATVTSEALAETTFAAWATAYAVVAAGALKRKTHGHVFYNDAYALPAAVDGAEFGEHAVITTTIEGIPTKNAVINLPMPRPAPGVVYLSDSGEQEDIVDTNSADLLAYLALFKATGNIFISDGEHSAGNIVRGHRA